MSFFFSSGNFDVIPDSEEFEDNDLSDWVGDVGSFTIQSNTVFEGSYALESTTVDVDKIIVRDENLFNPFGLEISSQIYIGPEDQAGIAVGSKDGISNFSGYSAHLSEVNDLVAVRKYKNGSIDKSSNSGVTVSSGSWKNVILRLLENGTIEAEFGGEIASISDTEYTETALGAYSFEEGFIDDIQFSEL